MQLCATRRRGCASAALPNVPSEGVESTPPAPLPPQVYEAREGRLELGGPDLQAAFGERRAPERAAALPPAVAALTQACAGGAAAGCWVLASGDAQALVGCALLAAACIAGWHKAGESTANLLILLQARPWLAPHRAGGGGRSSRRAGPAQPPGRRPRPRPALSSWLPPGGPRRRGRLPRHAVRGGQAAPPLRRRPAGRPGRLCRAVRAAGAACPCTALGCQLPPWGHLRLIERLNPVRRPALRSCVTRLERACQEGLQLAEVGLGGEPATQ